MQSTSAIKFERPYTLLVNFQGLRVRPLWVLVSPSIVVQETILQKGVTLDLDPYFAGEEKQHKLSRM